MRKMAILTVVLMFIFMSCDADPGYEPETYDPIDWDNLVERYDWYPPQVTLPAPYNQIFNSRAVRDDSGVMYGNAETWRDFNGTNIIKGGTHRWWSGHDSRTSETKYIKSITEGYAMEPIKIQYAVPISTKGWKNQDDYEKSMVFTEYYSYTQKEDGSYSVYLR
jgi:hypothetical protein